MLTVQYPEDAVKTMEDLKQIPLRKEFPTGGRGSGGVTDPLGSQGSLTLSQDHSLLFAVNARNGYTHMCVKTDTCAMLNCRDRANAGIVVVLG
jgi:hypothetical protein